MDDENYSYSYEVIFSGNGEGNTLGPNQYRVVLRLGARDSSGVWMTDYHFWYQTYDGTWADKHAQEHSEHLPMGVRPSSTGTTGWAHAGIDDFYNGPFYVYIITVGH